MAFDFPNSPSEGQTYTPSGGPTYVYHAPLWELQAGGTSNSVLYVPQTLTDAQEEQARINIEAAPFNALAANNIILNGNFAINQEYGDSYAGGTRWNLNTAYCQDQWVYANSITASGTRDIVVGTTQATPAGLGRALSVGGYVQTQLGGIPSPAANDYSYIQQAIEGARFRKLGFGYSGAQPFTLSFWVWSLSVAGVMCVSIGSAGNRFYCFEVPIAAAGVWQYNTLTFPPETTTPANWDVADNVAAAWITWSLVAGSSRRTQTAGSWQTWTQYSTPAQSNFLPNTNSYVVLTGVSMLPGTKGPSAAQSGLAQRPYGEEKALCQRYFHKKLLTISDASTICTHVYPVAMRASATVFFPDGTPAGWTQAGGANDQMSGYCTTRGGYQVELRAWL